MRTPRARGRIVLCASSSRSSFPVRPSSVSFLSSSPEAEEGKGGRGTGCRDAMRGFLADGGNYIGTLPTRVEERGAARPGCPGRGERGGERMRMRCRRTHRHCKKRGLVFLALSSLSGCSGCQMASPNMDRLAPSCGTARNGFVFLSRGGKSRQGRVLERSWNSRARNNGTMAIDRLECWTRL